MHSVVIDNETLHLDNYFNLDEIKANYCKNRRY